MRILHRSIVASVLLLAFQSTVHAWSIRGELKDYILNEARTVASVEQLSDRFKAECEKHIEVAFHDKFEESKLDEMVDLLLSDNVSHQIQTKTTKSVCTYMVQAMVEHGFIYIDVIGSREDWTPSPNDFQLAIKWKTLDGRKVVLATFKLTNTGDVDEGTLEQQEGLQELSELLTIKGKQFAQEAFKDIVKRKMRGARSDLGPMWNKIPLLKEFLEADLDAMDLDQLTKHIERLAESREFSQLTKELTEATVDQMGSQAKKVWDQMGDAVNDPRNREQAVDAMKQTGKKLTELFEWLGNQALRAERAIKE